MTGSIATPQTPDQGVLDALDAYLPRDLRAELWQDFFPDVRELVLAAGPPTRLRVMRDIKLLAAVARFVVQQGQPLTAGQALAETTLLAFDQHQQSAGMADGTRQNNRAILRRLQASHRGAPPPSTRRTIGARATGLVGPRAAESIRAVEAVARSDREDGDACSYLSVLSAERTQRRNRPADPSGWARAKAFAARHGVNLTPPFLSAAVTHEVLLRDMPLATLIRMHGLSRVDLDLGLTHARDLPESPSAEARAALRGSLETRRPGD